MNTNTIRIFLTVATIGSSLVCCQTETNGKEATQPVVNEVKQVEPQPKSVELIDAEKADPTFSPYVTLNGTLIVPPNRHATMTLTMGGTVHSLYFLPGQYVRKGAVIAQIENPDFISLQQNYLEAVAQSEFLETEYKRQQTLSEQEAATKKRFQESKADYESMKIRMDATAAQLRILGVDPVALQKTGIRAYLDVRSPLDGYITGSKINLGTYLSAGESLCDIIDKGETMLCLTAFEKDLEGLEPGNRIEFQVNGIDRETFSAVLISVGQEVNPHSRSLDVYARVNGQDSRFRPGMYITARIDKK